MENKDSKDILPKEDRLTEKYIESLKKIDGGSTIEALIKYHKALESSEERVKQLEEENIRLKGLLLECFEAGARNKMKPFTTDLCEEDCPDFEDWCNKNNIL